MHEVHTPVEGVHDVQCTQMAVGVWGVGHCHSVVRGGVANAAWRLVGLTTSSCRRVCVEGGWGGGGKWHKKGRRKTEARRGEGGAQRGGR